MQLDARDAETSVPAILNGEHSVLFRTHYDPKSDARSCVLPDSKRTRRRAGYLFFLSHFPCANLSYTIV